MRDQKFNKIKKVVFILFAVFFVIAVTAASASACTSKVSDNKCKSNLKEKVTKEKVKDIAKPIQRAAKEKVADKKVSQEELGNKFLDFVENNWFGSFNGDNCDNEWGGNWDNGLFGDDWDNGWD
jgi:hypothetical protein